MYDLPVCANQHRLTKIVPDETMMTIHINANLRSVLGKRVGMLHWIMDPVSAGFIIGYDLDGNQVFISNFDVGNFIRISILCH